MRGVWAAVLVVGGVAGCNRRPLAETDAAVPPPPVQSVDARADTVRDAGLANADARDAGSRETGVADNCADGGRPPGARSWLDDSCLWEAVPDLATCAVQQARLPSPLFPTREFSSCGDGCRVTGAHVDGSTGLMDLPRGFSDGQRSFVRMSTGIGGLDIREIVDVTRGETIAAFETRNATTQGEWEQCGRWPSQDLGPVDVESWDYWTGDPYSLEHPVWTFYARSRYRQSNRLDVVPGSYVAPAGPEALAALFDVGRMAVNDDRWGYLDQHSLNGVHASDDWTHLPPFPSIADAPDHDHTFTDLSAWGSAFIWSDYQASGGLYAWTPAGGGRLVAQSDGWVHGSAIAATGVVWLVAHGTQQDANGTTWVANEELWWVADLAAPKPVRVATGLGPVPSPGLVTGDGLAALVSCDVSKNPPLRAADCALVVVELASRRVWALGLPSAGMYWSRPSVVNARELVVGAVETHPFLIGDVRDAYVLDVTKLDGLEALFPGAAVRPTPVPAD